MLRTDKYEGIYPITNLRFLEGHPKSPDEVDQEIIPDLEVRPKRQAAEMAKDKIKQMSEQLHLQAILNFNPYKFNTVKNLEENA